MPRTLKKGTAVRLVQPVIEGTVKGAMTNGDEFGYMVEYKGEDGETHERFFTVAQLEEVK